VISRAKAPTVGSTERRSLGRRGFPRRLGAPSLPWRLAFLPFLASAFLLVPAAQASAFTFNLDIEGSGSGTVAGSTFLEPGEVEGEIDCSGPPPSGECEASFGEGGNANLTATPDPGSEFVEWVLSAGTPIEGCATDPHCFFFFGAEEVTATAVFAEITTPPALTNVEPDIGPTAGANTVTLEGTDLENATEVKFGSSVAKAPFTENTATKIKLKAPGHAAGTVDVIVITAGGPSPDTAADDYTYVATPAVTTLSPAKGPTSGGNQVQITGLNLAGASVVEFGETTIEAPFAENTATSITVDAPAHPAGTVNVKVTTLGGTSGNFANDDYTYQAPVPPPPKPTTMPTASLTGSPPPLPQCLVPKLKGLTLAKAKSALTKAHCTSGELRKPKGKKPGQLIVKSSTPGAGASLPAGSAVDLGLGPKPKQSRKGGAK
jgi:hypothetical protein